MMKSAEDFLVVVGEDDETNERIRQAILGEMAKTYKCSHCWKEEDESKGVALDNGEMACRRCARALSR